MHSKNVSLINDLAQLGKVVDDNDYCLLATYYCMV